MALRYWCQVSVMHCDSGFRGFSVIAPTYAKNDEAYKSTARIYVYLYRKSWCRHQAVLSHEHRDQCSKKRNSKGIFDLWGIETNKLQPSQKTTTVNKRHRNTVSTSNAGFLSWPACQGFHLGGPIWRLQHPTQPDIWHVMSAAWPTWISKQNLQLFQKKNVNLITYPTTTGFSGIFISPQYICHVFVYEV